jgi:tRNA(Glu) U13 pseudouridine synthase TruD
LIDTTRNTEFFYVAKTKWAEMPYQPKTMVVAAPVRWYNTMISLWTTQAGDFQKAFMQKHNINPKTFALFKTNKIYGLYRSIWTYPRETKLRFDGDDILLEFSLESWSYASIIVDELLQVIS